MFCCVWRKGGKIVSTKSVHLVPLVLFDLSNFITCVKTWCLFSYFYKNTENVIRFTSFFCPKWANEIITFEDISQISASILFSIRFLNNNFKNLFVLPCSSPPSQRRYLFDRSDEEEEEEEKEEGGASLHYPRYRYNTSVKGRDGEDKPYETAS